MSRQEKRKDLDDYLNWLFDIIKVDDYCQRYRKMLLYLFDREFDWSMNYDENREEDGFDLRKKFADETGRDDDFWIDICSNASSVLEMMIALSIRIEDVVYDPIYGNRTGLWFWEMVKSIGLECMFDSNFDKGYCCVLVDNLLNRKYERNGEGGLFTTNDDEIDMRKSEIWYQMAIWIDENFDF